MDIKKLSKKRQKSLASALRTSQGLAASAAAASPAASAAAASPQSVSFGSLQPATMTTDQSIRAIDQLTLPATLLPVTEPTIHVAPVPVHSEASAPTCQPSLTFPHIPTSPEGNLDSVVATVA